MGLNIVNRIYRGVTSCLLKTLLLYRMYRLATIIDVQLLGKRTSANSISGC